MTAILGTLSVVGLRAYADLAIDFGPGPQLVWGANAAGKTSLLEAIILLSWGHSHRTSADAELIRWGADFCRVVGRLGGGPGGGTTEIEVVVPRPGPAAGRKRVRVNGVGRRPGALTSVLRIVAFVPEEMLLVVGSPGLRRSELDRLSAAHAPSYTPTLSTYTRALQQRNSLLRAIREDQAGREELGYWDRAILDAGSAVVDVRRDLLRDLAAPLAAAHSEIAPGEGSLELGYVSNAEARPGESSRDALARRLAETADREIWNGTTLIGPHRDDVVFRLEGRDMAGFASRGQQRTAILALKMAELDLLTERDGRPPLLLLDDVFSELDPARRAHLVRRIADLPQAFVTTTTPGDLDPALLAIATGWHVDEDVGDGARVIRAAGAMIGR